MECTAPLRRWWLLALPAALAPVGLFLALTPVRAQQSVTISVIDVVGDLSSVKVILDNYKKAFPNKVKEIKPPCALWCSRSTLAANDHLDWERVRISDSVRNC